MKSLVSNVTKGFEATSVAEGAQALRAAGGIFSGFANSRAVLDLRMFWASNIDTPFNQLFEGVELGYVLCQIAKIIIPILLLIIFYFWTRYFGKREWLHKHLVAMLILLELIRIIPPKVFSLIRDEILRIYSILDYSKEIRARKEAEEKIRQGASKLVREFNSSSQKIRLKNRVAKTLGKKKSRLEKKMAALGNANDDSDEF